MCESERKAARATEKNGKLVKAVKERERKKCDNSIFPVVNRAKSTGTGDFIQLPSTEDGSSEKIVKLRNKECEKWELNRKIQRQVRITESWKREQESSFILNFVRTRDWHSLLEQKKSKRNCKKRGWKVSPQPLTTTRVWDRGSNSNHSYQKKVSLFKLKTRFPPNKKTEKIFF